MTNITSSTQSANPLYPRLLGAAIERDLSLYPVVAVMGARQVGKSTLAHAIASQRGMACHTLDDSDALLYAQADPSGFLADLGDEGAFIDEVQRAPDLLVAIKAVVDLEQRNGRYLLSGSAQPKIRSGVGDSLVGRVSYRTLRPLLTSELRYSIEGSAWSMLFGDETELLAELALRPMRHGDLDWRQVVPVGGYPRVVAAPPDARREIASNYLETFIARDLPEVLSVSSHEHFGRFVRVLATRVGQPQNTNSLAGELNISANTAARWIDALERSYLLERIPAFYVNAGHRITKAAKLFFNDAALALVAANETLPNGMHLENFLATDLKVWEESRPGRVVYHWRVQGGAEVDFILEQDQGRVAVEVKGTNSVGPSDTKHLQRYVNDHGAVRGVLLSADPEVRILARNVVAAPWWAAV